MKNSFLKQAMVFGVATVSLVSAMGAFLDDHICLRVDPAAMNRRAECNLAGCYNQLAICEGMEYQSFMAYPLEYRDCLPAPDAISEMPFGSQPCLHNKYFVRLNCEPNPYPEWDCERSQWIASCR